MWPLLPQRPPQPDLPDLPGARCAEPGRDPEMWFDPRREAEARAVCAACPARRGCAAGRALDRGEWGVWGGLAGAGERSRRRRGRAA